jgi:hypothetical protein
MRLITRAVGGHETRGECSLRWLCRQVVNE